MKLYFFLTLALFVNSYSFSQDVINKKGNYIIVRVVEYELDVRKSQYFIFNSDDEWIKSKKSDKILLHTLSVDSLYDLQLETHDIRYDTSKIVSFNSFEKAFNDRKFLFTDYKKIRFKNGNTNGYLEFFCAPLIIKYSRDETIKDSSKMIWEDSEIKMKICWNYKVYIEEVSFN